MSRRQVELDGLRALAILLVAGNHYAHFWTPSGAGLPLLPYGDALQWMPFESFAGLGVALFFVISGYMISQALDRSGSLGRYALLRAIRLWPTLLLCGTLTFLATSLLGPPELQRSPVEAGISVMFLPPEHVGRILGHHDWEWLDGAYWTLWVQARFFALAGLFYFLSGGRLLNGWLPFAVLGVGVHLAVIGGSTFADHVGGLLFADYQPYFTAGIGLALVVAGRRALGGGLFAAGLALALGYEWADGAGVLRLASVTLIFALVALAVLAPRMVAIFGWGPVVAMGQASFIFYLLHQNFGLALTDALPEMATLPAIAATLGIQLGIALFSVWAFRTVERPMGRWLRGALLSRQAEPVRLV